MRIQVEKIIIVPMEFCLELLIIIIINAKINYKNQFTPIKGAVFSVSTLSKTTLYQCIIQKKG